MKGKKKMSKTNGKVKSAKKPTLKAVAKPAAKELLNLKVSQAERKLIEAKAKAHADGNVSAWLRYAGTQCVPRKKDVKAA